MKGYQIIILSVLGALMGCAQLGDVGAECSADSDCKDGLECHMHEGEDDHGECEAHDDEEHEEGEEGS